MKTHENLFPLSLLIYPDLSMVFNKKVLYRIYAKNLRMFHRKIAGYKRYISYRIFKLKLVFSVFFERRKGAKMPSADWFV